MYFFLALVGIFLGQALLAIGSPIPNRPQNHSVKMELPPLSPIAVNKALPALKIKPYTLLSRELVSENSTLEICSHRKNTLWILNDSGNGPYIFAIDISGEVLKPKNTNLPYKGIRIPERRNIDWEAMTRDNAGNLIIADFGNNLSNRKNLCFYIVPEPSPFATETKPAKKISFYYPSQNFFPDPSKNYDAEACFALNGKIYFFTKHWSNTETILWSVNPNIETYQAATPISRFNAAGLVTDASLSPAGTQLAVLTYHNIWIFDLHAAKNITGTYDERRFFQTPFFRKISPPMKHWQLEGIAFIDEETLIVSAESGALFKIPVKAIKNQP